MHNAVKKTAGGNLPSPLPMRDGVSASKQFLPAGSWRTMLEFLQQYFPEVGRET